MTPRAVVQQFIEQVRSGKNLERAFELMAPQVLAHQVISELEQTVQRSPQNYVDHVLEMRTGPVGGPAREVLKLGQDSAVLSKTRQTYGEFTLELEELLADGNRVYVRWRQWGRHLSELEDFPPTNKPLLERASAVYRVVEGKIVEYWIQIDRAGLRVQLERNAG